MLDCSTRATLHVRMCTDVPGIEGRQCCWCHEIADETDQEAALLRHGRSLEAVEPFARRWGDSRDAIERQRAVGAQLALLLAGDRQHRAARALRLLLR